MPASDDRNPTDPPRNRAARRALAKKKRRAAAPDGPDAAAARDRRPQPSGRAARPRQFHGASRHRG